MKKILNFLRSKDFLIFLILSFAGYIIIEKIGLFRTAPASYREIFHSTPSKVLSILFLLNTISLFVSVFKDKKTKNKIGPALFLISIVILIVGLWVSIYTRFEGKALRAEGQSFEAFPTNYITETVYKAKYAKFPEVGVTILKLNPITSPNVKKMVKVEADILYAGRTTKGILNGKLSSSRPLISDWTMVRITDFGYATKYILYGLNEQELESNFLYIKLFPPGAEDSFTTMFLGYVFYLRCYPDYIDNQGKPGTLSAYPKNPMFNLRIVRNKDIVYNGLLKPDEKLRFDNVIIAVPEVKMWVEISFIRDLGLPVAACGLLLMVISVILMAVRKK